LRLSIRSFSSILPSRPIQDQKLIIRKGLLIILAGHTSALTLALSQRERE